MTARSRARRSTGAAHLILGADSYLRQQAREELLGAVPEEARAFAVQEFSLARADLDEVQRAATTPTLLSPRQVLLLRGAESLGEEEVEQLEQLIDSLPDFTLLIFEEAKLDGRTRVARLLLDENRVQKHVADSPKDAVAFGKVEEMARELGLRLSRARAEELVFVVGTDLGTLQTELEKLRSYVGKGREVAAEDLAAVVVAAREFEIFDMVGLIAERRRAEALRMLQRLLVQGENPIPIVGLLTWLYRQLLIAQALPPGTPPGKARVGGPPERKEQLLRVARKMSREQLREAFAALAEADLSLKSSAPDPQAVVELLVVRLTAGADAPPRPGVRG